MLFSWIYASKNLQKQKSFCWKVFFVPTFLPFLPLFKGISSFFPPKTTSCDSRPRLGSLGAPKPPALGSSSDLEEARKLLSKIRCDRGTGADGAEAETADAEG